jgi:hypothetical protein
VGRLRDGSLKFNHCWFLCPDYRPCPLFLACSPSPSFLNLPDQLALQIIHMVAWKSFHSSEHRAGRIGQGPPGDCVHVVPRRQGPTPPASLLPVVETSSHQSPLPQVKRNQDLPLPRPPPASLNTSLESTTCWLVSWGVDDAGED